MHFCIADRRADCKFAVVCCYGAWPNRSESEAALGPQQSHYSPISTHHAIPPHAPSPPFRSAGTLLQDLHVYDPAAMAWTDLSATASGTPPSARMYHGFTSAGGKLYVHGGYDGSGESKSLKQVMLLVLEHSDERDRLMSTLVIVTCRLDADS